MIDNPKLRWGECLAEIRHHLSEQQFKAYFSTIEFESYSASEHTLLLRVPNQYAYEYIEENYAGLLTRILTQFFGQSIVLQYRVMKQLGGSKGKDFTSDAPAVIDEPEAQRGQGSNALPPIDSQLNPRQTFDNFIEGTSNKMARSVGLSIAEHPKKNSFNPLFIYGPSGCGKTHLINAIGVKIKQMYPALRVLYVSARTFQLQFTESRRRNTTNDFIHFYQTIDVLIVDDIQEWMSKEGTQHTFFHIFNHLFMNGKRIILASDRPPVEMEGMEERLLTRFKMGLIAEMEKPNEQLCIDILYNKIHRDGLSISADVVKYIAQTANGSVRDLEGVITSLLAYSVVYNSNVDMRLAERVIQRAVKVDNRPLQLDEIIDGVCQKLGVEQKDVMGKSRKKEIALARHLCMYFAQKYTRLSGARIGKLIGGRDHSTVIHSCGVIEQRMRIDELFRNLCDEIAKGFRLK